MIEVALEASSRPGSVATRCGESSLHAELSEEAGHASDLCSLLDGLVRRQHAQPSDISAIFVGTGPGSFTGLRVAIATAMGIARGTGARVRSVPSFEALVFERIPIGAEAYVMLNAYSAELYLAKYRREERDVRTLIEPHVIPAAQIELNDAAHLVSDQSSLDVTQLGKRHKLIDFTAPKAQSVLELGAYRLARLGAESPETIEPLYLRPFAAKKRQR